MGRRESSRLGGDAQRKSPRPVLLGLLLLQDACSTTAAWSAVPVRRSGGSLQGGVAEQGMDLRRLPAAGWRRASASGGKASGLADGQGPSLVRPCVSCMDCRAASGPRAWRPCGPGSLGTG